MTTRKLELPVLKALLMRQATSMVDMVGKQEPPAGVARQLRSELQAAVNRAVAAMVEAPATDNVILTAEAPDDAG